MTRSAFSAFRLGLVRLTAAAVGLAVGLWDRLGLLHWQLVSDALSRVPFTFGLLLRREVYDRAGGGCGAGTALFPGVTVEQRETRFGREVWVSAGVYIQYASLEDYVMVGQKAVLLAGRHHHNTDRVDVPIKLQGNPPAVPLWIGEGAWIGANATVMADVGRHAVVGAGSVVLEPVPDYAIVVGNPARFVRDRRAVPQQKALEETP